jgi:hypothetical protein
MTLTDDNFWDCECETHFIHKKAEKNYCPKCQTFEEDQPDSRREEITKQEWKQYGHIGQDGMRRVLKYIPNRGTCLVPCKIIS